MAAVVVVANEEAASASAVKEQQQVLEEVGTLKKGPWTSAEDAILVEYVKKHGEGNWNAVQKHSGLFRCGKSCRLRWANHLRPNLKKGAFTTEEEHIIMELHAKLGNKWARMAAQLPGRTDNEIKNYWNTRIKRRQRAGLPLYSPDIHFQGPNQQNHQSPANELSNSGGQSPHDHLPQHDRLLLSSEISNVSFDGLKPATLNCPPFSGLTDFSMNSVLNQTSSMASPIQRFKRFRDNQGVNFFMGSPSSPFALPADNGNKNMQQPSFKTRQTYPPLARRRDSFAQGFTYDPDPVDRIPSFGGALTGSHALANGSFSASRSSPGLRPELPSSQFAESVPATVTGSPLLNTSSPFASSPLPNQADACLSPNNSGLLEALLQEAQQMGVSKPHSSEMQAISYGSYIPMNCAVASQCKVEWGEDSDPITPLDGRTSSVFSESTPTLSTGPWEESSTDQSPNGIHMKSEEPNEEYISSGNCGDEDISTLFDFTRPDVSLVPDWYGHNAEVGKEQSTVTDALATVFNDEFGIDIQQLPSVTSPPNHAWGLGSCPWNNMPGVC